MTQHLKISSLLKIWHGFTQFNNRYVLAGSFCQTHKKFRLKTNGFQGSCNCIVAALMAKVVKMELWNVHTINQILSSGDQLYERSVVKLGNKALGELNVNKVYPNFILLNTMVTFQILNLNDPLTLVSTVDQDQRSILGRTLNEFLNLYPSCIAKVNQRHIAIWTHNNAVFLFDPTEHESNGDKWKGLLSMGYAICVRFLKAQTMAEFIFQDIHKGKTLKVTLWPIEMQRCHALSLKAPENMEQVKMANEQLDKKKEDLKIPEKEIKKKKVPPAVEKPPEKNIENLLIAEEQSPDVEVQDKKSSTALRKYEAKLKAPVEPHMEKIINHFTIINDNKMGIIRASTHQMDKNFSRFRDGEQSISQAVAALVMRRDRPSQQWIKKLVNEILKLGETIHHQSLKEMKKKNISGPFELSHIIEKIVHPPGEYTMDFEEQAILGKLDSDREGVLDLYPALVTFLRTYDCCIINGPIVLAVWFEGSRYYMYDPNERNGKGGVIDDPDKEEIGFACVTWFTALKDLVHLYVENLPQEKRRENFHLSKVIIEDYIGKPDTWNNFQGVAQGKWILRGTMSQSSHVFSAESRNTQCTANATMSIAFVHIRPPNEWTSKTVDQVLMSGDEFYRKTVERLEENNKLVSKLLMVDELDRNFSFSNKELTFEIHDCYVNGILGYPDDGDVLNIKTGLMRFFEEFNFGVLTSRNISVAVWKKDGAFYYFDSHSRDNKGLTSSYGTACVLRLLTIDDLAKAIESNLGPNKLSFFNISAINVNMLTAEEEGGMVRQPLNNFKLVIPDNENVAILLAKTSNKDPKFEFNAGKQTVPMCVTALGMNKLRPSSGWNAEVLGNIIDIGQKYFEDCMAEYEANGVVVEEDKGITSRNLGKEFKIGLNKIEVEFEQVAEGFVEDGLEAAIGNFYTTTEKTSDDDNFELLVETENITVSVWKDDNLFYVFDPYPRDANGQVIGKDAWSAKLEFVEPEAATEGQTATPAAAKKPESPSTTPGGGGDVGEIPIEEEKPKRPRSSGEGVFEKDEEKVTDSDVSGKACILFFYNLEDVISHILENTRPNQRSMMPFTLTRVQIKNSPMVREIYDKDFGERKDGYSGNWYDFLELDYGHWILRGQTDMNNEMFPLENRGKQEIPTILTALAFAKLYAMSKMKSQHIASILCYGDRLFTHMKRLRKAQLEADVVLNLLEEEIKAIMKNEVYDWETYSDALVIGDFKVEMKITKNFLTGDTNAKNVEGVLDLKAALDKLFETSTYGIIDCKAYLVGVWKGATVYYMFDCHKTSVNGVKCSTGYPCITRYLKTELMADIYLQNLEKEGCNTFFIHKVDIKEERYQRPKDIMEKAGLAKPMKMTGFTDIVTGKSILRGGLSQDDPKFGRIGNALSAPVAYVALTMSLIHKPATWSKPIVDEVISVGDELFTQTAKEAGTSFNPWEHTMDPYMVSKDYRVGVLQANIQLKKNEQSGILEIRDPKILNLRQGFEKFFAENTHGILYSPPNICYAVWEEMCEGLPIIYLFDPNRRSSTGLPSSHGTACVITFGSAKMASDHILACVETPDEKHQKFTLIPVEIIVGPYKTVRKKVKPKSKLPVDVNQGLMKQFVQHTIIEERKATKKKATELKKKADEKKQYWQGRNGFFQISKFQHILRGTRCLTSSCYQEKTRGFQGIPVCIVSFVAHAILPVMNWTWKEIDAVLDTGDQLYIDSYIAYSPRDKRLGLQNVLRNIYIMDKKAHVTIYKPIKVMGFTPDQLARNLEKWFLDQNFCMLEYLDQWVGIFFKKGYYFLFDPHERGPRGCKTKKDGAACVIRFELLEELSTRLVTTLLPDGNNDDEEIHEEYQLVLVKLEGGICQCS
ncbi:hypothetical protein WA026_015864 [Henosepilachna vigintioctopunctata]|uniref:DNA-directed DNA polymerase n=1 Tax=Henosepilachna vigintioctopunctata TaxID=420089 RepID=A0AAW1US92_9CUCU